MVGNAVWVVHGAAVYGVVAAAESHLPVSKAISHTYAEQAGRQSTDSGQTGCMEVTVHYKSMSRLSGQRQHDGRDDVLGNTDTNAQEMHLMGCTYAWVAKFACCSLL